MQMSGTQWQRNIGHRMGLLRRNEQVGRGKSIGLGDGIFGVVRPLGGVVGDVLADLVQGSFAADDVFVIIALPQATAECEPAVTFDTDDVSARGECFESAHHVG